MTIDLYYTSLSAPCRVVMLAAKALGVELNYKLVDLMNGEHMTPEYLKLNPQHAVPTLVDNGFALSESRAIITYLANKYGKGSTLYPEDPQARALVDQRLHFDSNTLYARFGDYAFPQWFGGAPAKEAKLDKAKEALGFLETFLQDSPFVAGSSLTLADLSIVVTVTNFLILGIDLSKYPKIKAWVERVKAAAPGYQEANEEGRLAFHKFIASLTKK